jgi:hypothetical protein
MNPTSDLRSVFILSARWIMLVVLSGVTFASSMVHLGNPYYFLDSILAYRLVPERGAIAAAAYLPYLELVLSIAIWLREFRRASLACMVAMFGVYAAAQGVALSQGLKISCGCFGPASDQPISLASTSFAGALALTAFLSLLPWPRARSYEKGISHVRT